MLHVATEVKGSRIHGLGLFTLEKIPQGRLVWRYNPKLDRTFTDNYLDTLPPAVAAQIRNYSYINVEEPNLWILCGDDARFLNFPLPETPGSIVLQAPNLHMQGPARYGEFDLVAARDIEAGEELTVGIESDYDAYRKLSS